jgi:Cof subfamily protein (haloacid dehalogenase superfamily)
LSKIVFFDIDGTLLDHEKNLPLSTKKAIKLLKENGVYVAIATGRAPFMFEALRKELDIDSFVSFNGQYVVFENEVIFENPLNDKEIHRLFLHSQINNHPLIFMNEHTMKSTVNHDRFIEESMGSLKFTHPDKDSEFYLGNKIYQTLLFCEESEELLYTTDYPNFEFIRWHPFSADVIPAGGSKAEGLRRMLDRLGFDIQDAYAFGDGLNDIEMLRAVGTGVAMGNAVGQAKAEAELVTRDVSDEGIWFGLKELKLI